MRARIRWSRDVVLSSALLVLVLTQACGARRAPSARFDDLDRTSLVRGRACDRSDQDTTHYLHLPLFRACAVTVGARRIGNDLKPEFMPVGRDRNCFAAVVEVVVDTRGRPEPRSARLVRSSDPAYGAAVLAIVPGLRFEPAHLGDRPVRQIYELREVLLIRRSRGLEGLATPRASGGGRMPIFGSRTPFDGPPSDAPNGIDLPALKGMNGVC
jgi:hypothetical protein